MRSRRRDTTEQAPANGRQGDADDPYDQEDAQAEARSRTRSTPA